MRRNFRRLNKENGNTIINMSQISYVPSSSTNGLHASTTGSCSDSETSISTDPSSSRGKRSAACIGLSSAITGIVKKKVKLNMPMDASSNYIGKSDLKRIFLIAENIANKLLQENDPSVASDDNIKKLASGVCKHCDFKDPSCLVAVTILQAAYTLRAFKTPLDEALGITSNNENMREQNTYPTQDNTTTNDKNTTTQHSAKASVQMEAAAAFPIPIENLHNYIKLKPKNMDKSPKNMDKSISTKKTAKGRASSAALGLTSGYDDLSGNLFALPLDDQIDFDLTTDESDVSDNVVRRRKKIDLTIATSCLDSSETNSLSSNNINDYQHSLLFQLNLNEGGLPAPDTIRLSDFVKLNSEQQEMNLESPFSLKNNFTFSPPLMLERSHQLNSANLLNETDFNVLNGLIQSPDDKHLLVLPKVESIDTLWAHSLVQ